ncbi:MAG TPA: MFS transporter [Chloroflexota bacterium]|nr:MFS transporter [Chloroflexota bacterium]
MARTAQAGTATLPRMGPRVWVAYPWIVLAASTLVQTAASFGSRGISPLAPFLVDDLGLSRNQIGLLVTATYLGGILVLIVAGSLSDRFGVRTLFLVGLTSAGLTLALASQAPDFVWLLLPMLLFGLGNGFSLPPTTRAIVEWFPNRRRGLAMGIKQTGVALAGVICGFVVPPLGQAFGWRGAVLALGTATVASGLIAWLVYRERAATSRFAVGDKRPSFGGVVRNRNLLLLSGVSWLYAGVQLSILGFLVLFMRERVGLPVAEAGAMLALAEGGGVVGRIGWGVVSDTLFGGRRKVVMGIIGALAAASSLGLALAGPETPRLALLAILAVAGVSAVGWNGINMTFVAELAGRQSSATAAGLNLTASYLGIMVGPPLFGLLVDATGSYTTAFEAGAIASLLALVLLWQVRPDQ